MTAYNAERYIEASVNAALAQDYPDFELVVVNDGSTDGTERILCAFHDQRLRYFNGGRIGRTRALNAAIAESTGEYIAINDADDLSLPHRLRYTIRFFQSHRDAAIVGTGFLETTVFLSSIPQALSVQSESADDGPVVWPSRAALYRRNVFYHSTLMYSKHVWERIGGYDENLTINEDYDFYLRALQYGPAAMLPGRTVLWYTNPDGFFKRKSKREYLGALRFIRSRAHGLLGLPGWLRWYPRLWELGFHAADRYPSLLDAVKALRRLTAHKPLPHT